MSRIMMTVGALTSDTYLLAPSMGDGLRLSRDQPTDISLLVVDDTIGS